MEKKKICRHPRRDIFYYPAVNEDGWKCVKCGKELGFKPNLDKELIYIKVDGLLHDMVEAKLIHISNATQGEVIANNTVWECKKANKFDQYFIIEMAMKDPNLNTYSDYWKKESIKKLRTSKNISEKKK